MTWRVRTALVSVVGFVAAFAVVLVVGTAMRNDGRPDTDTLDVVDALATTSGGTVAVRGFLFYDEETGPLLCSQRTDDDPPACDGSVLELENVDPNRLDLIRPAQTAHAFDAYSSDEVALLGTKLGAVLRVQDVLP